MRTHVLVALALLAQAGACHGQGRDAAPAMVLTRPDHLEPIWPGHWAGGYAKLYRKLLQLPAGREAAVMVYLPSFEPEECVVLHEAEGDRTTYTLVHTRAERNIWYSMAQNRDDGKPRPVYVKRREVPLPPDVAGRVCRIWERMLRGVRYPAGNLDFAVLDGTRVEFWRHGMCGETVSPERGAPKLLVELGRSLIDYCSASEDRRPSAQREVEQKCRALERYLVIRAQAPIPPRPNRPAEEKVKAGS